MNELSVVKCFGTICRLSQLASHHDNGDDAIRVDTKRHHDENARKGPGQGTRKGVDV